MTLAMPRVYIRIEHLRFYAGVLFFIAISSIVIFSAVRMKDWLLNGQALPLDRLVIQGNTQPIVRDLIDRKLSDLLANRSVFSVNVNSLQQQVESIPWVYRAVVRKQWPDRLSLYVTQQPVVAHWDDGGFINTYGDLFKASSDGMTLPMLTLGGRDDEAKRVLEMYQKIAPLFSNGVFHIQHLQMTERGSWLLKLDNGWQLFLGQQNIIARLNRFLMIYSKIQPSERIVYLDLRYDTGISVGWKSQDKTS